MPQQRKRKYDDFDQVLGRRQQPLTIEEFLKRPPVASQPTIDEFLKRPVMAPPSQLEAPDFFENLWIGARRGYYNYVEKPIYALAEAGQEALRGNLDPALQIGELATRGVGGLFMGGNPSFAAPARSNEQAIAETQREQQQRRATNPAFINQAQSLRELDERAALDP